MDRDYFESVKEINAQTETMRRKSTEVKLAILAQAIMRIHLEAQQPATPASTDGPLGTATADPEETAASSQTTTDSEWAALARDYTIPEIRASLRLAHHVIWIGHAGQCSECAALLDALKQLGLTPALAAKRITWTSPKLDSPSSAVATPLPVESASRSLTDKPCTHWWSVENMPSFHEGASRSREHTQVRCEKCGESRFCGSVYVPVGRP